MVCKHAFIEIGKDTFYCSKCGIVEKVEVATFMKGLPRESDYNKKYTCQYCGKEFDKPGSLGAHVAVVHKGIDIGKFIKKDHEESN